MPRSNQVVTSAYANITQPTNPFTQVNLSPNKDVGVSSYDNAELIRALEEIYTYSQQDRSILLPMINQTPVTAMFQKEDLFGKVQLVQKTEESPYTPLYVPTQGTRSYSVLIFHQGMQIAEEVANGFRRYPLRPKYQMELAKAIARLYDNGIIWALTNPVLEESSAAANTFSGIPTQSTTALPDNRYWMHGKVQSSAIVWDEPSTNLVDDIVDHFEGMDIGPENLCVIAPYSLRRKLKAISDFRDADKTIGFWANENARIVQWDGLKFIFMMSETGPAANLAVGKYVSSNGPAVPSTTSGAVQVAAGSGYRSFLVVDLSTLEWGTAPFASAVKSSLRDDLSYTMQFYTKVGFGGVRLDDAKVLIVTHKA